MTGYIYFEKCPNCKVKITDYLGYPDLYGLEDSTIVCSKCKTKFKIVISLKKVK
jgi:hypothetical protein